MNADTLRDLSTEELDAKSQELREQLLKMRFQQSTGQIENAQVLRSVRKDIARVMTIRREKVIAAGVVAASVAEPSPAAEPTNSED